MSSCKACGAPTAADEYETPHDGLQEEICCPSCIRASRINMPEDYYEGLWFDSKGHPSHVVISPLVLELEEAHAQREAERTADSSRQSSSQSAG